MARRSFAEGLAYGRLLWWEAADCPRCGPIFEADGADRLTDDLRAVVLGAEGAFRVDVVPRSKIGLIRVLRTTFEMSLPDAVSVYEQLPVAFRSHLTRIEAECIAAQFPPDVADVSIRAMELSPPTFAAACALLTELGAPPRLLRHVELVGEAAELLLVQLARLGVELRTGLVRVGVVLHDAGKTLHPGELDRPGTEHEPAGEALLLRHNVSPEIARICLSHARWATMTVSLEELLVALADKLWKGVRTPELEERVVTEVATKLGKDRWSLFIELDSAFERIAADGTERLERSRI